MGLDGVRGIAAGKKAVYALVGEKDDSGSYQILRWVQGIQWELIKGQKASKIAVGKDDKLHIVTKLGRIYWPNCTNETFSQTETLLTTPMNLTFMD